MPQIPFAFQWTIAENKFQDLKDSIDGCLLTDSIFDVQEIEFYFGIYPNGDIDVRRGETWIFLHLELGNLNIVEADFIYAIESANYSTNGHYIYEKSEGCGTYICKTDEFFDAEKKFFFDEKLIIKVNGIFKFEINGEIPAAIKEQKWEGGEVGNELWKNEETKDFSIVVDGKEIKVHKLILGIRSEVFTAMLNSNMKESIENKVNITDFSFNVVETGIKFIYHCNFTTKLSIDELMELLQFFDKYDIPALMGKIEPLLISQISQTTVVRLTNCSVQTNSFKLKEKCMEFLMATIASKSAVSDIDDLDKDIAIKILKNSLYRIVQTEK